MFNRPDYKVIIAKLETKIEYLQVSLTDKDTEIRRLKLDLEKQKDFWMRELAFLVNNNRPTEGAVPMEMADLIEPSEEEEKNRAEKSKQEYNDWRFWNEGNGLMFDPDGYKKVADAS